LAHFGSKFSGIVPEKLPIYFDNFTMMPFYMNFVGNLI